MTANRFRFRAWDSLNKRMVRVVELRGKTAEGGFLECSCRIDERYYKLWLGENCFLMQSTGLEDKNGKEIFEGDIIRYGGENIIVKAPEWFACDAFTVFGLSTLSSFRNDYSREDEPSRQVRKGEVIGNIYEHPELIEAR